MRPDLRPIPVLPVVAFFVMMGMSIISPMPPLYALSFVIAGLVVFVLGLPLQRTRDPIAENRTRSGQGL